MAKELTPRQLKFVEEYLKSGNGTEAVIKAGYSEKGADVQAYNLLRNHKIQEYLTYIQLSIEEIFREETKKSLKTIIQIRDDKKASAHVRLRAAQDLLDRAGYKPTDKVKADIQTTHSGSITTSNEKQIYIIQELVNRDDMIADRLIQAFRERSERD